MAGIILSGMFPLGYVYSQTDDTYSNALKRARRTSGIRDHDLVHVEQIVPGANLNAQRNLVERALSAHKLRSSHPLY